MYRIKSYAVCGQCVYFPNVNLPTKKNLSKSVRDTAKNVHCSSCSVPLLF